MEMVGHDHEVAHMVSIAIKVHQAPGDDLRKPTVSKHASSVTFIQSNFSLSIEMFLEFDAIYFFQLMDGFEPIAASPNEYALTYFLLI
jgi:hypothetical protein